MTDQTFAALEAGFRVAVAALLVWTGIRFAFWLLFGKGKARKT